MNILIGDTGLIGTTLKESIVFDYTYNSKNIERFNDFVYENSTIYLSCLPATKWIVNKDIKNDINNIYRIIEIISKQKYNKVILISTIDVYSDSSLYLNEDSPVQIKKLSYGTNRYLFELLVKNFISTNDIKIFRLPALYNRHIKKNIIFDLINNNNVEKINGNSQYQWYNLDNLYNDIIKYSNDFKNENIFNLFTEPIDTMDIVKLFPEHYKKIRYEKDRIMYDFTTKFKESGYILTKEEVIKDIKKFLYI